MVATVRHQIRGMSGPDDVNSLIYSCRRAQTAGSKLILNLSNTAGIYPNGAVPMAAALQYFLRLGLNLETIALAPDVSRTYFLNPRPATSAELASPNVKNIMALSE